MTTETRHDAATSSSSSRRSTSVRVVLMGPGILALGRRIRFRAVRLTAEAGGGTVIYRSPEPDVEVPENDVTSFVLEHAAERGDKPALIDGPSGRELTYEALASAIRGFAAGLAARGFGNGDVLAIYMPNVPEYAVAFHGAAFAGGTSTTVNPLYTPNELAYQLEDSRARI